jgi:hypothetical protein
VLIDAVGDRRAAQFVRVYAAGDSEDFAPDFEVEAAVARLPDGYSVEVRLPFLAPVTEVHDASLEGVREGAWQADRTVEIKLIRDNAVADAIAEHVKENRAPRGALFPVCRRR